jgi:hypothetical protein
MRILTAVFAVALLVGAGMVGCNKEKNAGTTPNANMADGGTTQPQSFTPPPAQ